MLVPGRRRRKGKIHKTANSFAHWWQFYLALFTSREKAFIAPESFRNSPLGMPRMIYVTVPLRNYRAVSIFISHLESIWPIIRRGKTFAFQKILALSLFSDIFPQENWNRASALNIHQVWIPFFLLHKILCRKEEKVSWPQEKNLASPCKMRPRV